MLLKVVYDYMLLKAAQLRKMAAHVLLVWSATGPNEGPMGGAHYVGYLEVCVHVTYLHNKCWE